MKNIDFKKGNGLVPVIIQDFKDNDVLMLGFMNKAAFEKTRKEGFVFFWSRTRNKLWMKGETSGNKLRIKNISIDCDSDTLLITVKVLGTAVCHTGTKSCFTQKIL